MQGVNENSLLFMDILPSAYRGQSKKSIQKLTRQSISTRSPREYENGYHFLPIQYYACTNKLLGRREKTFISATDTILHIYGLNIREVRISEKFS
jgi:hypothetical protein